MGRSGCEGDWDDEAATNWAVKGVGRPMSDRAAHMLCLSLSSLPHSLLLGPSGRLALFLDFY